MQHSFIELPIYLSVWPVACFCGPAIGPGVSGFAVEAGRWRLGLWEDVWLASPILIILFFPHSETSADTTLCRRVRRLHKRAGYLHIKSKSGSFQANLTVSEVVSDALIKPMEIFDQVSLLLSPPST